MAYVGADRAPSGCIFCELPRAGDARENLVLEAGPDAVVMLNRFPYNNGHLMVAPRRHTGDLAELSDGEYRGLMDRLRAAVAIVQRVLTPDAMNVGANLGRDAGAGIADHLHWHVVPRWAGDTNFMPVIGDVKVMPQHLLASWDQLRPHFAA